MAKEITLTCKMGKFTFNGDVAISKAKRIRDEIMGQFFNPKRDLMRIHTARDAETFVRTERHMSDCAHIPFEVVITV